MNRYLMDRASRRSMMQDGRNPYGSRGGYVMSRRGRGRDRAMDYGNDYAEYNSGYDSRYDRRYGSQDSHYGHQQYGEYNRPMDYEIYGVGGIRPMGDMVRGGKNRGRDYGYDMNYDYNYDMRDYASEEEEWKKHLKKWCEELKHYDKFNMPKDQVINQARQMKVKFDNYNEEEFYATYLMKISDDEDNLISNPQMAIIMAKNFLEDKDSKLKGSDKLCAYYYEIIKGGEED
jgi:hypothetical protein